MITSAADLIYMLGWELEDKKIKPLQTQLFVELSEEEKVIFNYLKKTAKDGLDSIALNCSMPTYKLASILLAMELKGVIRPLPGKLFELM